jgi:hypothetical protein
MGLLYIAVNLAHWILGHAKTGLESVQDMFGTVLDMLIRTPVRYLAAEMVGLIGSTAEKASESSKKVAGNLFEVLKMLGGAILYPFEVLEKDRGAFGWHQRLF